MKKKTLSLFVICMLALTGCGANPGGGTRDTTAVTGEAVSASAVATPVETKAPAGGLGKLIGTPDPDRYVHGEDGYYNLDEEGTPVHLRAQRGGTCWLYAAAVAMETGYERATGKEVELDPYSLLDKIYGDNKKEGFFIEANPVEVGGTAPFVYMTLSNGFDQYVLDQAIEVDDIKIDTIKEGIKKYGALYIGIPDTDPLKKGVYHGYTTTNWPTAKVKDYDHSIAIIGWDDHFPKDYYREPATRDGAWITANSGSNSDYYYVSYDTKPEYTWDTPAFMSMTDVYSAVATYDYGVDKKFLKTGKETVTANVFHQAGTLAAVGTYSAAKDQDVTIEIYDAELKKVRYTQKAHLDGRGYHTVALDTPLKVEDYAIAIHYTKKGAPIEGKGWKHDDIMLRVSSKKGESFIRVGEKWLDLHEKSTLKRIGRKDKTNNCCIKGLYKAE